MNPYQETLLRVGDTERSTEIRELQLSHAGSDGTTSEVELLRFAPVVRSDTRLGRVVAAVRGRLRRRPGMDAELGPPGHTLRETPTIKAG